jgi:CDP-glucose 4,6-dehydratase
MGFGQRAVESLVMKPDFWRGKRVLITGNTGFKGSWLSLWLQTLEADVSGYSLEPPTQPNLFSLASVGDGMQTRIADVRDLDRLVAAVTDIAPEIVIHMAAQSLVRYSYTEPVETYATNVMGTVNLLEAVRRVGCARVALAVTSDKCYENTGSQQGYREGDPMGGADPYSSSKACSELIVSAFRNSYFSDAVSSGSTAVASARAGNVIGGGDWADDRLIPDVIKATAEGNPVEIRNPGAMRPWQHVLDPLQGYLMLIEHLWADGAGFSEGWNFGPEGQETVPVLHLIETLSELSGGAIRYHTGSSDGPPEAAFLSLDCAKARQRISWAPKLSLDTALEWVWEWYADYLQGGTNLQSVTRDQINRYMQL